MIPASNFEDLVATCVELLKDSHYIIIDALIDTINNSANYAAITVLALLQAELELNLKKGTVTDLIDLAEFNCTSFNIDSYKKILLGMKEFELIKNNLLLDNTRFFIPLSNTIH